ncbi:MAG: lipid A deacylase LpxR family protein [Myxococcales bacterium]|nr:lipid A deacylase LpxR family protein [Myxococcales bacterium]
MAWAVCASLISTDSPYDRGRFTLHVANDDFGSGYDEAFTSGIEARFRFTPGDNVAVSSAHPELRRLRLHEYWGLSLGQNIYTPALVQVTDVELLRDDRRYAGWLYGTLSVELGLNHSPFLAHGHSLYVVELSLGATGPQTQTESLQRYWHAFIRDVLNRRDEPFDPKGWGVYQVPNHWGVNVRLYQESEFIRWSLAQPDWRRQLGSSFGVRMATKTEVRLGNMWIDGTGGFTIRAGLMPGVVFDDWSLPRLYKGKMVGVPLAVYGFVSGYLRGAIYNALLDGPPGAEGPYPARTYFLTRIEAGFVIRFAAVEFAFRHTTLSPELRNRPPSGVWIQNWGTISLTFAFY